MNNLVNIVKAWEDARQSGAPSVLATVVRVSGSHYRRPGARMFAALPERPVGSVSGGCLEADVMERAAMVIRTGKAALVHYDTTTDSDLLFGSGLGCGGAVAILIEPAHSRSVARLMESFETCIGTRCSIGIATVFSVAGEIDVGVGDRAIVIGENTEVIGIGDESVRSAVSREIRRVTESHQSRVVQFSSANGCADLFLEYLPPPISLVLFGAGDDARPVCTFASELGWQVTVVDHRPTRVTEERFPRATALRLCHPEEISASERIGEFDAAVIMTHNYQHDRELLGYLLGRKLAYIGLLGAAKRAERILNDLEKGGPAIDDRMRDRLYAPVGLDLNADGPEEIALAIVAEIQMVLNGGSAQPLRRRRDLARTPGAAELTEWR